MKIAQVAPLYESVPPQTYGGTERIVHYLTEGLIAQGHEVTLFASGDSRTHGQLEPIVPRALRGDDRVSDPLAPHLVMLDRVRQRAEAFDVIHFHTGCLHFPVFRGCPVPCLTTFHGRLDQAELRPVFETFRDFPAVSISDHQRQPVAWANWVATVYHGLPEDGYTFHPEPGAYLAFLCRLAPEKRPDRAIEIAVRSGLSLKIAAKVDPADREYYQTRIKPLIKRYSPQVEYLGEIEERDKNEFLGQALALLFPIDWPEPFGLVMIEALACGTPVIAFRQGSVPEVLCPGETGFIVADIDQAVAAVARVGDLRRTRCRQEFEDRFSVGRMVDNYLRVYRYLLARVGSPALNVPVPPSGKAESARAGEPSEAPT